jgi:uncharacterized protein (DUF433 family)
VSKKKIWYYWPLKTIFVEKYISMTTLEKAEILLPEMSMTEKAILLQWLTNEISGIYPGIEKTPGVCGGDACVTRTRIPVWSLVHSKKLGMSDLQLLDAYPTLTVEDLYNAWNYYRGNREEIEEQILENEAF